MYTEINTKYRIYISNWLLLMFFLVATMIIVGGLTRLTDSGLSMTTWNLITGAVPPLNQEEWINVFNLYKNYPEYNLKNLLCMRQLKI